MFHLSESQGDLMWGVECLEGYNLVLGSLKDHLGMLEEDVWVISSCPT